MRNELALLASLAVAICHAGPVAAQDEGALPNERTKGARNAQHEAPAPGPSVAPDLQALAVKAAQLVDQGSGDWEEPRRLLGNVRADARFDQQPVPFRAAVTGVAGFVEMSDGQAEDARRLFRQAIELQDRSADLWYWLSWVEADLGLQDDAARSLARIFRAFPDEIDALQDDHIWRRVEDPKVSEAARTELLQAIFDSGWKREALGGPSHFHYELALVNARRGDVAAMRRIVPGITGPMQIVRMLGDKRFDAVVDRDDPAFDPRAAAERSVATMQAQLRRFPDRLDVVAALQWSLMVAGRFEEVITLSEDVQAAIAAAPADKPPYVDMDGLAWVKNQHANALEALGRTDQSLPMLEAASRLSEQGQVNVSQTLNLAHLYASLGRPDDALAAVARAGSALSDFGRMVKVAAEHRAFLQKDDQAGAARALAYLRENRGVSEEIYLAALVDAGDLDAAAATLIAQLESEKDRAKALYELHEFKELPPLPGNVATREKWKALKARPDVRAAANRVGRILEVDLYWSE